MRKFLAILLALAITGGVVAFTSIEKPAVQVACDGNGC
jgi:hypothetical protein